MTRALGAGGGPKHTALVRWAAKKIIDGYDELTAIDMDFESDDVRLDIRIDTELGRVGHTRAHFIFRPDIVVRFKRMKERDYSVEQEWKNIHDSRAWLIEAETDPRNIFSNVIKIEGYRRLINERIGRWAYALILVCYDDAVFPENRIRQETPSVKPFDELWICPREE